MRLKKLVSVCMLLIMSLFASVIFNHQTIVCAESISLSVFNSRVDSLKGYTNVTQIYNGYYNNERCYRDLDNDVSWECAAWALFVWDSVWKQGADSNRTIHRNINNLCAGDYVRYNNGSYDHSIFVTKISGNTVYYTDGNGDNKNTVAFDKTITKSALQTRINNSLLYNLNKFGVSQGSKGFIVHYNDNNLGQTLPSVPSIAKVTGNGSNVTVTWNSVADADRYVIDFWDPQSGHNYFAVAGTSITKTLADGQYGIRISAENSAGPSGYSYFTYIWVSKSTVPEIPEITSISVNGSDVTVTWDKTDITSFYVVDFWDVDGAHHFFSTADTSITKTLADGQYGIRIAAENTAGSSGNSYFGDNYIYIGKIHAAFDANGGTLDSSVKAKTSFHSINGIRGEDQLVIFTTPGSSTGTNAYGVEVLVDSTQKVVEIIDRVGNATVPPGGFILSGHGEKQYWLAENIEVGDYISYHDNVSEVWVFTKNKWLTVTKKVEWHKPYGELPVPLPREGYRFDGWYTAAEGGTRIDSNSIVDITVDAQTLYAHWVKETYSISYNTNGSGAVIDSTTEKIGTNAKITETIPVREGYRFLGWAASETAASPEYQPGDVYTANTDITLYAVWEELPYTLIDVTSRPDFDLIDVELYHLDIGCTVVLAAYKDEKLVDVQYKKYNGDMLSFVAKPDYDCAKVIVLDGFDTLTPLCDAEEIIK